MAITKKAWAGACFLVIGVFVVPFALVILSIGVWAHNYVPIAVPIAAAAMAVVGAALCFGGWWVNRRK